MPVELSLTPTTRDGLVVYEIEPVRALGVDAFITGRSGGVSGEPYDSLNLATHVGDNLAHVLENRRRVARAIGVDADRLITAQQVHGDDVLEVVEAPHEYVGDGLVTSRSDLALAILVADCVPVLLVDPRDGRFALAHAGWRGLYHGVLDSAAARFLDPRRMHAVVGPAISLERYQVGPEVAEQFTHVPGAVVADEGDRSRLDLAAVTIHQLRALGVEDERITRVRDVTDDTSKFFSDRAARPCGRFALVARRAVA